MNMRMFRLFFSLLIIGSGTACGAIPVRDGRVPSDYVQRLETLSGKYSGAVHLATIDGQIDEPLLEQVQVTFTVDPDGTIRLETAPDWLGESCGMKFGKLLELWPFEQGDPLHFDARFETDPGRCADKVKSDSVLVTVNHDAQGQLWLRTYLTKGWSARSTWRGGTRAVNYFGTFFKER